MSEMRSTATYYGDSGKTDTGTTRTATITDGVNGAYDNKVPLGGLNKNIVLDDILKDGITIAVTFGAG
jgi:hypothetical protein